MKSSNFLSSSRMLLLLNQYWIYYGKLALTSILALIGGLFLLLYSIQIITRFDTWRYEHFMYVFVGVFMVLAVVCAGSSFPGLRSKEKSYHYLLRPATITQKFIFQLITHVVLFILVLPVLYWSIFYLEGKLVEFLNPDFTFQSFSFIEGFKNPIQAENYKHIALLTSQGLLFLTAPFFGATVFMKQPIIKTLAWVVGLLFIFFMLFNGFLKSQGSQILLPLVIVILLINILMVLAAYFRLKSKQIL